MYTIEKWSLNNHKLLSVHKKLDNFDDSDLFKKITERPGFQKTDSTVTIPSFFIRVEGVVGEEDNFYDRIFNLDHKLKRLKDLYIKFEKGLDKRVDNTTIEKLQPEWERIERKRMIDPENILKCVELSNSIKKFMDKKHHNLVLNSLHTYFKRYFELKQGKIQPHKIKNILFHIVYWVNLYSEPILKMFDYSRDNPKVLYYGQINKREVHFLYFLSCMGFDVIYINTESTESFEDIDPQCQYSHKANAPRQVSMREFPNERISSTMQTDAFSASEELRETLHSEDSMFYRPWQLIDYCVESVKLITTYDEVGILAKEQSIMRHGWDVSQGMVTIPSFFAKVIGVRKDINQYYEEINALKKLPKVRFFDTLPICKRVNKLMKVEYYSICGRDGLIDVEKMINSAFWPYKRFQRHVQKLIANAVREFCNFKGIKRQKVYGVDEQKLVIFTTMMTLDEESLQLLQVFDYPREVPKCIIYNNELNGELIFEDSILIYFFSSVGMDVVVYNPAGHNDIEIYIDEAMFNCHHLEEVAFKLPFKSISVFGKYIK